MPQQDPRLNQGGSRVRRSPPRRSRPRGAWLRYGGCACASSWPRLAWRSQLGASADRRWCPRQLPRPQLSQSSLREVGPGILFARLAERAPPGRPAPWVQDRRNRRAYPKVRRSYARRFRRWPSDARVERTGVHETQRQLRCALLGLYGMTRFLGRSADEERDALQLVRQHLELDDAPAPSRTCAHDRRLHQSLSAGIDSCAGRDEITRECRCRLFPSERLSAGRTPRPRRGGWL
jgi:hypothetical protein